MAEEDLIFGSKRHLFGGIQPSNMKEFRVLYSNDDDLNRAKITATLPDNTIINGQTLCTVAGAVIRRKKNSVPVDEFDGELAMDIKTNGVFYDANVDVDVTYGYAAFPYTTYGVYNRDPVNAATVTILNGYPPEPLSRFTAITGFAGGLPQITLSLSHPGNTQIDGKDVNTLAGIMVRRSKEAFPVDETQGVLIKDFAIEDPTQRNMNFEYVDTAVEINSTYYYSAFPYTTKGVYNRDAGNRATTMVDAGEPPANMPYFTLKPISIGQNAAVTIEADLPASPEEGLTVSVPIRKKAGGYPESSTDGELVTTFYQNDILYKNDHHHFNDINVEDGVQYFYQAFPTTSRGAVNTNAVPANQQSVTAKAKWVFGLGYNPEETDPSLAITYTNDNASFASAYMDYATDTFNYGSWDFEPGTFFMPKPCVLNKDGTVRYYLNPENYGQKADGTAIESMDVLKSSGANMMMEWLAIYTSHTHNYSTGYIGIQISNVPISGSGTNKPPISNFAAPGKYDWRNPYELYGNKFYTAIFPGGTVSETGNTIRSLSEIKPYYNNTTAANMKAYAEMNNVDPSMPCWSGEPSCDSELISFLLVLMGKSTDCQKIFGMGELSASSNDSFLSGSLNDKGMFYGSSDSSKPVKVFGMESLWGGLPRYVLGYFLLNMIKEFEDIYTDSSGNIQYKPVKDLTIPLFYKVNLPFASEFMGYTGANTGVGFPAIIPDKGKGIDAATIWWIIRTVDSSGNYDSVTYTAPKTSEYGNGFISKLSVPYNDENFFRLEPGKHDMSTPLYSESDYWNHLKGSDSTYVPDYMAIKTYPSGTALAKDITSNWKSVKYIPCYIGSDIAYTMISTIKRAGPFALTFSTNLTGCNVRIRYVPPIIKPEEGETT